MRIILAAGLLIMSCAALAQTAEDHNDSACILAEDPFCGFDYVRSASMWQEKLDADSTDYEALTRLSESWNLLGLDYKADGDKDSARFAIENAVRFAERTRVHYRDSAVTYVNLAAAYGNSALFAGGKAKVRIGRDVQTLCQEALRIDPTNMLALTILGVFHRELSKLSWVERLVAKTVYGGLPKSSVEQSVEYLEKAIEVDSTALFPNYSLAVTYRRMKEEDAALAQLEKVLKLTPRSSEEVRYQDNAITWLAEAGRQ